MNHPLKIWLLAIRPKTLSLAVTPVLVGTALAWAEQRAFAWGPLLAALGAALLIQAGTNLHNDAADFERGADGPDRLGPRRVTAEGWLSPARVRMGAHLSFAAALLLGAYLVRVGGWPILLLGLVSLAAGYAYTGGPKPIAYTPLGELFVLLFFGIAAVAGSSYLQTYSVSAHALLAGGAVGLIAAAVLLVNNYRDLETDRRAGKHTLAVTLGRPSVRLLYALLLLLPFALILPLHRLTGDALWLTGLALPMALWLIRMLWRAPIDTGLNRLLARTAQLQLLFGLLLGLALIG
ncbi:1,4-dihydroxy-2-naphthoate polyprenyltransferase [Thiohalobacter sp. IOR34]|uniref:1,4-dihydroxy-2-naphthoate polyprenyltransferase n=1 Tax=Thiohalobacter sp. IOR34 TaxID=3057176 RepID=UPI0025B0C094|nr:1,4-dihydroxy-2-naphthoate polyprenyltransferase [Thiohalobacter sp. IOR34]WJW75971.1 1,4-dihydroxy-2-naphthoate polyprenyltransferase [Thiohalobacter sp. IOR34]